MKKNLSNLILILFPSIMLLLFYPLMMSMEESIRGKNNFVPLIIMIIYFILFFILVKTIYTSKDDQHLYLKMGLVVFGIFSLLIGLLFKEMFVLIPLSLYHIGIMVVLFIVSIVYNK